MIGTAQLNASVCETNIELISNKPSFFSRYFKWKESHVEPKHYNIETDFYCKLCSDLWDATKKPKIYEIFSEWWNKDKNCILHDENYKS